jgi:hypothetical protein
MFQQFAGRAGIPAHDDVRCAVCSGCSYLERQIDEARVKLPPDPGRAE